MDAAGLPVRLLLTPGQASDKTTFPALIDGLRLARHVVADRGFFARAIIEKFDVRTPSSNSAARSLSGGNLQKFVIGREVLQGPDVLVVNQPTWGVDALAAASIRQALLDLAAGGTAVIVVSQDLDELMEVADNFAALNEGRLTETRPTKGLSIDEIGLMMGGAHGMEVAHV